MSQSGPFVIHIFVPLSTKWSPRFSARSFMLTTSEPAFGSLIARAPICSPDTSLGKYFAFCAAVPLRWIWLTQRFECAPYDRPIDAEAREISSIAIMWAR